MLGLSREGFSLNEFAQNRGLFTSTICEHIARSMEDEEVPLKHLFPSEHERSREAIKKAGYERLRQLDTFFHEHSRLRRSDSAPRWLEGRLPVQWADGWCYNYTERRPRS